MIELLVLGMVPDGRSAPPCLPCYDHLCCCCEPDLQPVVGLGRARSCRDRGWQDGTLVGNCGGNFAAVAGGPGDNIADGAVDSRIMEKTVLVVWPCSERCE